MYKPQVFFLFLFFKPILIFECAERISSNFTVECYIIKASIIIFKSKSKDSIGQIFRVFLSCTTIMAKHRLVIKMIFFY